MTRMRRVVLERKLEQARRLALEPTDPPYERAAGPDN
jgi:hypothetical protein